MNEETKITRRRFLVWTGATVGASVLTCGGLGVWATRPPEIEFVESSYGKEKNVKDKILSTPRGKQYLKWTPPQPSIEDFRKQVGGHLSDD